MLCSATHAILENQLTVTCLGIWHDITRVRLKPIGKPQLGILWSRDSLGFKRLCGNNPKTMWSTF